MNKGFSIVIATLLIASSFIGGILGYQIYRKVSQQQLGATIPKVVAVFETTLASKISSSATSMTLTSGTDKAGNSISGYMCFVLDEGTASEEFVCGTASSTSVTGMIRGIDPVDGDLEVSSLKKEHRRGASVKVTNYPQLAIISRVLNGDETLPNPLEYDSSVTTSTLAGNNQYVASVDYVNNVALSGAPDADLDTKGIVEIPTREEVASGATHGSGDTSAYMCLPTDYAATSSSATTTIPITLSNGKLDQSFWDLTQNFSWSGQHTFGATTTFNGAVNMNNLDVSGSATMATTTFSAIPTLPASNPTSDNQAARKAYVDTKLSGFGSWGTFSKGTVYQASTDLIIVGWCKDDTGSVSLQVYTDSSNPPTTERVDAYQGTGGEPVHFSVPVKSGDYYEVDCDESGGSYSFYKIPLQ